MHCSLSVCETQCPTSAWTNTALLLSAAARSLDRMLDLKSIRLPAQTLKEI
eukprot:m.263094 g.263094  ORF g.263094 m.263094 type:complete len:51 (+) comp11050_c1_seq2:2022-2174(+)